MLSSCFSRYTIARTVLGVSLAYLATITVVSGLRPREYTVTDLGTLGGNKLSMAEGMNNRGEAAGVSYLGDNKTLHGFRYTNGMLRDVGTLGGSLSVASDINNSGHVVGASTLPDEEKFHAFVTGSNGTVHDIGTMGGSNSRALSINKQGAVVGFSHIKGDTAMHAFLYEEGKWQDLTPFDCVFSTATAINDQNAVTGYVYLDERRGVQSYIYTEGSLRPLPTLGGA